MIYNILSEQWEDLVYLSLRDKQINMWEMQKFIFDELDEECYKKFNRPYFEE